MMGTESLDVVKLEVKYCENCSGLWIRGQGDHRVYCRACRQIHCRSEYVNQQLHEPNMPSKTRTVIDARPADYS